MYPLKTLCKNVFTLLREHGSCDFMKQQRRMIDLQGIALLIGSERFLFKQAGKQLFIQVCWQSSKKRQT